MAVLPSFPCNLSYVHRNDRREAVAQLPWKRSTMIDCPTSFLPVVVFVLAYPIDTAAGAAERCKRARGRLKPSTP